MPLFWCPYCLLCPAWLSDIARATHCEHEHPMMPLPTGDGLAEWKRRHVQTAGH
jgi:hypothetical protein